MLRLRSAGGTSVGRPMPRRASEAAASQAQRQKNPRTVSIGASFSKATCSGSAPNSSLSLQLPGNALTSALTSPAGAWFATAMKMGRSPASLRSLIASG